jgi:RNA polymerase sigma-70 factor (ECF subfamily)
MQELARGRREAIEPLYRRHATLIFKLAVRSLEPEAADDLVQDVFQAVWQHAGTFDSRKGTFHGWVSQIAHFRIVNELRRRRRRPQAEPDPDQLLLFTLPGSEPEPSEAAWRDYRISSLHLALAELDPAHQQALILAFIEGFTHEEVASLLNLPLGTVKSRIRFGLQKLRATLGPVIGPSLKRALGASMVSSPSKSTE